MPDFAFQAAEGSQRFVISNSKTCEVETAKEKVGEGQRKLVGAH